jgi:hypothetical protein
MIYDPQKHSSISLGACSKRVVSSRLLIVHLQNLMVGVSARIHLMNVDGDGHIGPLLDEITRGNSRNDPLVDPGRCLIYRNHFGIGKAYLSRLSYLNQRFAFPSAIRTMDTKTYYYVRHNSLLGKRVRGGLDWMRMNKELVGELFLQAIITETSGRVFSNKQFYLDTNPKVYVDSIDLRLPTISKIKDYLDWMGKRCTEERGGDMTDMLHSQYVLGKKFDRFVNFQCFMNHVVQEIPTIVSGVLCSQCDEENDRRSWIVKRICDNFSNSGFFDSVDILQFLVSQILADMEECIDDDPFGPVIQVPTLSGSASGIGLINFEDIQRQLGGVVTPVGKLVLTQKLDMILSLLKIQPDKQLAVMGIERHSVSKALCVSINKRKLNRIDAEHMACKLFIIYERLPSGARAFSKKAKLNFPYCHPIKGYSCTKLKEEASRILDTFKDMSDAGTWQSPIDTTLLDTNTIVPISESVRRSGQHLPTLSTRNHSSEEKEKSRKRRTATITPESSQQLTDEQIVFETNTERSNKRRLCTHDDIESPVTHVQPRLTTRTHREDTTIDSYQSCCIIQSIKEAEKVIVGLCMVFGTNGATYDAILNSKEWNPKRQRDTARCILLEEYCKRELGCNTIMLTLDRNEDEG